MTSHDPMSSWDAVTRARVDEMNDEMADADLLRRAAMASMLAVAFAFTCALLLWVAL